MKLKSKKYFKMLLASAMLLPAAIMAQQPVRPAIYGIAHISVRVSDMQKARDYYGKFLGFDEAFAYYNEDKTVSVANFKVNDRQYIEITPTLKPEMADRLNHYCLETADIEAMRLYLKSKGVQVPDKLLTGRDRNLHFMTYDPDGHKLEFVQMVKGSDHDLAKGKFMNENRISSRMPHIGITVKNAAAADKFYKDILGFSEIWRGGMNDSVVSWVNMKLPESTDYIEYMLTDDKLTDERLHSAHHLCLATENLQKEIDRLRERPVTTRIDQPRLGRNNRWLVNMYDPDGTRIELMEPYTFK